MFTSLLPILPSGQAEAESRGWGCGVQKKPIAASVCLVSGDPRTDELLWIRVESEGGVVFIGALYHTPKCCYHKSAWLEDGLQ